MAQGIRRPHEAVDFAAIERAYPPPPEYFETAFYEDRETMARILDWCETAHPIFGRTQPTPEQAYEAGRRLIQEGGAV